MARAWTSMAPKLDVKVHGLRQIISGLTKSVEAVTADVTNTTSTNDLGSLSSDALELEESVAVLTEKLKVLELLLN